MDLHKMALFEGTAKDVGAISKAEYQVSPERLHRLEGLLPALVKLEYWNPVYQAWRPFLDVYFKCGCNPSLTVKYGSLLMSKEDYLNPPRSRYSDVFEEISKLRTTTGTVLFEGMWFNDIRDLCETQILFFMQNRKRIVSQLHNSDMFVSTMRELLSKNTWRSLLCAVYLYRHSQLEYFEVPNDIVNTLSDRLSEWVKSFIVTFDEVTEFVSDNGGIYGWYCESIRNVIIRVWESALQLNKRVSLLTPSDVNSLSPYLKQDLIAYVNSCPVVYDNPFKDSTIWDCLCNIYYSANPNPDTFIEETFYALCIPKSYIKRFCDGLNDFYWIVKDGHLTQALYDRKITEFSTGENRDITPEMYLSDLYMRGFPELGKE